MDAKRIAAEKAVEHLKDGMVVGLGTGSTASWAIRKIGENVKLGLNINAVASSLQSENLARSLSIPIHPLSTLLTIDLTIDGADEVDPAKNLIKGGGGALLREKILAYNSKEFIVIVDESKLVQKLGKFPLPVEITPFARELTLKQLQALGCKPVLRKSNGENFFTDNGNLIADCNFYPIEDPAALDIKLKMIPGVVETGLFLNTKVTSILAGYHTGEVKAL